ncbi:hypothetical protein BGZ46_006995 [Entomortierella lignicola]|nr:hypothetical protein BGZ46_006995 [Entomortierella lignicola]
MNSNFSSPQRLFAQIYSRDLKAHPFLNSTYGLPHVPEHVLPKIKESTKAIIDPLSRKRRQNTETDKTDANLQSLNASPTSLLLSSNSTTPSSCSSKSGGENTSSESSEVEHINKKPRLAQGPNVQNTVAKATTLRESGRQKFLQTLRNLPLPLTQHTCRLGPGRDSKHKLPSEEDAPRGAKRARMDKAKEARDEPDTVYFESPTVCYLPSPSLLATQGACEEEEEEEAREGLDDVNIINFKSPETCYLPSPSSLEAQGAFEEIEEVGEEVGRRDDVYIINFESPAGCYLPSPNLPGDHISALAAEAANTRDWDIPLLTLPEACTPEPRVQISLTSGDSDEIVETFFVRMVAGPVIINSKALSS